LASAPGGGQRKTEGNVPGIAKRDDRSCADVATPTRQAFTERRAARRHTVNQRAPIASIVGETSRHKQFASAFVDSGKSRTNSPASRTSLICPAIAIDVRVALHAKI